MPAPVPIPLLTLVLEPKTHADQEKLALGLATLVAEDPTIGVTRSADTGQVTIAAIGELQLEIIVDRLKREFDVDAALGRPQVAYKETFTRSAEGEGRFVRNTGGRGQYGHVKIRVTPREPGEGCEFLDTIVGSAIPGEFIQPIEEGIREAMTTGVLAGYPVDDVSVELYGGSFHDSDSSEMAFAIAGALAFNDAAKKAGPVVLEPIMRVQVSAPRDYVAEVMASLENRRGQIESRDDRGATQIVQSRVPLSEMLGYAADLRSRTQGRATYVIHFDRYEPRRPGDSEGPADAMASSPRFPVRPQRRSRMALPEPDSPGTADEG